MLALPVATAILTACQFGAGSWHSERHLSVHTDADGPRWHLLWATPRCRVDVTTVGTVTFTPDATDVADLQPGGSVDVTEQSGGHTRRVQLRPMTNATDAMIDRIYTIDGAAHLWDAEAEGWFAGLLLQVDHASGALVDVRFPQLMAAGGPSAVLDDVAAASDGAKHIYLMKLFAATPTLDADGARQVAIIAGTMTSDDERAQLLIAAAPHMDWTSASDRDAYFHAVAAMTSDYPRSRVLLATISAGPASGAGSDELALATIASAQALAGDHEKARVLIAIAGRGAPDDAVRAAYIAAARTIASDTERARVLTALARQG